MYHLQDHGKPHALKLKFHHDLQANLVFFYCPFLLLAVTKTKYLKRTKQRVSITNAQFSQKKQKIKSDTVLIDDNLMSLTK